MEGIRPINRIGIFLIFMGILALLAFMASLYTPDKNYNLPALIGGMLMVLVGWQMARARAGGAVTPKTPPSPAPAQPKPGLLSRILKGQPSKQTASPPPPAPAARQRGILNALGSLFKGKKKT